MQYYFWPKRKPKKYNFWSEKKRKQKVGLVNSIVEVLSHCYSLTAALLWSVYTTRTRCDIEPGPDAAVSLSL